MRRLALVRAGRAEPEPARRAVDAAVWAYTAELSASLDPNRLLQRTQTNMQCALASRTRT